MYHIACYVVAILVSFPAAVVQTEANCLTLCSLTRGPVIPPLLNNINDNEKKKTFSQIHTHTNLRAKSKIKMYQCS